jgi:hypothetical protein
VSVSGVCAPGRRGRPSQARVTVSLSPSTEVGVAGTGQTGSQGPCGPTQQQTAYNVFSISTFAMRGETGGEVVDRWKGVGNDSA